jgi:hypothetical protein
MTVLELMMGRNTNCQPQPWPTGAAGPPPLTRTHGVFAPHAVLRPKVTTRSAAEQPLRQLGHPLAPAALLPPSTAQPQLPLVA